MQTKAMSTGASLASCCASVTCSARTGNREFRDIHRVGDAQAVLAHVLDMFGPGIDERDVLARLHHVGAGISADGAGSDDRYFLAHACPLFSLWRFSLAFLGTEASAPAGLLTMAERVAWAGCPGCMNAMSTIPAKSARDGVRSLNNARHSRA